MILKFKHGIIGHQKTANVQTFLQKTSECVSLRTSNAPLIVVVTYKLSSVLFRIATDKEDVWQLTNPNADTLLAVRLNVRLGQLEYETYTDTLTISDYEPNTGAKFWLNLSDGLQYELTSTGYVPVPLTFIAKSTPQGFVPVTGTTSFIGGTGGSVTDGCNAGYVLYDSSGRVLFDPAGNIVTTATRFYVSNDKSSTISSFQFDAVALTKIPAFGIVAVNGEGKIEVPTGNVQRGFYGLVEHPCEIGDVGLVHVRGIFTNPLWQWSGPHVKLFVSPTGSLTEQYIVGTPHIATTINSTTILFTGDSVQTSPIQSGGVQSGTGEKGSRGAQGFKGEIGPKGEKGEPGGGSGGGTGEKGEKGDTGIGGTAGEKGEKGDTGSNGADGAEGAKGSKGDQGDQGYKGAPGDKGQKGEQGLVGLQGNPGFNGAKGDKGESGNQGPKGDVGPRGAGLGLGGIGVDGDGNLIVTIAPDTGSELPPGSQINLGKIIGQKGEPGAKGEPGGGIGGGGSGGGGSGGGGSGIGGVNIDGDGNLIITLVPGTGNESSVNLGRVVGQKGEKGEDAVVYDIKVFSSNGNIFRQNEASTTLLFAKVFRNGFDVTAELPDARFRWRRVSLYPKPYPLDDDTWNMQYLSGYKQILISVDDVNAQATFYCELTD